MRIAKKLGAAAAAGLLALALIAPTSADARNGRIAAGIFGAFAAGALIGAAIGDYWGPYPYYYLYPAPVYYYPPAPIGVRSGAPADTTATTIDVRCGAVGTGTTCGSATERARTPFQSRSRGRDPRES
jgi:hypothetical protein